MDSGLTPSSSYNEVANSYRDLTRRRQASFLLGLAIISVSVTVVYFLIAVFTSPVILDSIVSGTFVLCYASLIWLVRRKHLDIASYFIAFLGFIGLFYDSYSTGKAGLFLYNVFPIYVFFLLGKKRGLAWTLSFVGTLILVYLFHGATLFNLPVGNDLRDFILAFGVIFVIVYLYQDLVDTGQRIVQNRDRLLAEERDRANAVVTSIGEGVFVIDRNRRILSMNPVAEKLLRVPLAKALNQDLGDIFPLSAHHVRLALEKHPASQTLASGETVVIKFDDDVYSTPLSGEEFPVSIVSAPLQSDGKTNGVVVVFRDITEEKEATEIIERKVKERTQQVREGRARLLSSINSLNQGFMITDHDLSITMMNDAARKLLAFDERLDASSLQATTAAKDSKKIMNVIEKVLGPETKFTERLSHTLQTRQANQIGNVTFGDKYLDIFISPVVVSEEVIGTVVLFQDITEAKVLERSKDEFFSIASHELRTPLTAIRGYASLMQHMLPTIDKKKQVVPMVDEVYAASIRLIDIVNDFLDLSRLEQRRVTFNTEAFVLHDVIKEVSNELRTVASQKKLTLRISSPDKNFPLVNADRNRVKEVLVNLIGNAIKFTEKGSVSIQTEPNGAFILVRIRDTGMGIPLKNQSLLFRKFQQAGESIVTRDASHGTGLGLYISKLMVEGMGGTISLESSKVNQGSTFSFTLPIAQTTTRIKAKS